MRTLANEVVLNCCPDVAGATAGAQVLAVGLVENGTHSWEKCCECVSTGQIMKQWGGRSLQKGGETYFIFIYARVVSFVVRFVALDFLSFRACYPDDLCRPSTFDVRCRIVLYIGFFSIVSFSCFILPLLHLHRSDQAELLLELLERTTPVSADS